VMTEGSKFLVRLVVVGGWMVRLVWVRDIVVDFCFCVCAVLKGMVGMGLRRCRKCEAEV
jgi:hypothetical protein